MGLLSILESITAAYAIQLQYKTMSTSSPQGVSYGGRIEIDDCLEPASKTLVLLHELAHELLHKDETRASTTRQRRELEAEAVAYVVASHFGLETASANYLALWDIPEESILASIQRIHQISVELICKMETAIKS